MMEEPQGGIKIESVDQDNSTQKIDVVTLKKEVDALQIAMLEQRTPWYKNISIILSVVALLFSFGTTFVSYIRTQNQDIQSQRVELRGLLQRLAALPRENVEVRKKYIGDSASIASISGFIGQESTLLSRQAAEIANRIPAEYISATEYYAIGLALKNAAINDSAMTFFAKAIDTSKDLNDRVSALRTRASLLFKVGQPNAGRVEYQKALNVFSEINNIYDDYTKRSTHIYTEMSWAFDESSIGSKDSALQHIENAERYLSGLIPSPGRDELNLQISQSKKLLAGGHDLTVPFSNSPVIRPPIQKRSPAL
jgi:tetratricopeptide (TPR) repeat protein